MIVSAENLAKAKSALLDNLFVLDGYTYISLREISSDRIWQAEHKHFSDVFSEIFYWRIEEDYEGYCYDEYIPLNEQELKQFREIEAAIDACELCREKYEGSKRILAQKLKEFNAL